MQHLLISFQKQFVNSYSSFFYLAFIAPFISECGTATTTSCMESLAINVAIVFGLQITSGNAIEAYLPYLWLRINIRRKGISTEEFQRLPRPEQEFYMLQYSTITDNISDYAETAVQFGYMTLFISCLPGAATLSWLCNILEVRTDGWKLMHVFQRPEPKGAEDIGAWYAYGVTNLAWIPHILSIDT